MKQNKGSICREGVLTLELPGTYIDILLVPVEKHPFDSNVPALSQFHMHTTQGFFEGERTGIQFQHILQQIWYLLLITVQIDYQYIKEFRHL